MAIIKNYKFSNPQFFLSKNDYWDIQLTPNNIYDESFDDGNKCLISEIDTSNKECIANNKLYSTDKAIWNESINAGVELLDIGLTGIDNGLITYQKDRINNQEFYDILTSSKISIPKDDKRFFLSPVSGNTLEFTYPYEIKDEYIALKGGFYQGFFKLFGFDYQVLPSYIRDVWSLEFVLRKKDYETKDNILNKYNPNNKGIFFYIGTRAENKFWELYNTDKSKFDDNCRIEYNNDNYFGDNSNYKLNNSNVINYDYFANDPEEDAVITDKNYLGEPEYINDRNCQLLSNYDFSLDPYVIWDYSENKTYDKKNNSNSQISKYFLNEYNYAQNNSCPCQCKKNIENKRKCLTSKIPNPYWYTRFETDICTNKNCDEPISNNHGCGECDEYFIDNYYDEFNNGCCDTEGYLVEDEYYMPDVSLDNISFKTSDGHDLDKNGYYEIISDNKFLLFNNTPTGYTTNNWIEGLSVAFTGRTSSFKGNYYLLLNHTKTGYTINDIDEYLSKIENTYDVINDIVNNAFALRIRDDNSIGYRYLINDCESEDGYKIIEEYSMPNVITNDKWDVINVKFKINDNIKIHNKNRKLKIFIYVNGFLVFISQEIPDFNFKELKDVFDKQECVPFSISLGGGTQGLCDKIWINYYELPKKILPIEKNFAGSFIGDFKSFKFYNCNLNFKEIKNHFIYENLKNKE